MALNDIEALLIDLLRSGSSIISISDEDEDEVPLDGMWTELRSQILRLPHDDLARFPAVALNCAANVPEGKPISPHFYNLIADITDLQHAFRVVSLSDVSYAPASSTSQNNLAAAVIPLDQFLGLLPRLIQGIGLRSLRWVTKMSSGSDPEGLEHDTVMAGLAFALARSGRLSDSELASIDENAIVRLFGALHYSRQAGMEAANDLLTRAILALNEQVLAARNPTMPNHIMNILRDSAVPGVHTFAETLIFLINRADDLPTQVMVLKAIYIILATNAPLFFTNDLRVLLDVVLRRVLTLELQDVGLRQAFLRVLRLLYPTVAPYKAREVMQMAHHIQCAEALGIDPDSVRIACDIASSVELTASAS